jgi:propionate CoA-transferase
VKFFGSTLHGWPGVVQAKPEHHWQTFATPHNPAYSGEIKAPMHGLPPMALGERKIIARADRS